MMLEKSPISVACGKGFSVVLTEFGGVYTFGNKESGKLGHGSVNKQIFPKIVKRFVQYCAISAGMSYVGYVDKDGTVFTWGAGFWQTRKRVQ